MRRSASANKRGRSPMETAQDSTPHKRQELAPPSIKSYSVPNSAPMSRNISPAPPREDEPAPTTTGDEMPDFLVQTDRNIEARFRKLTALESSRIEAAQIHTKNSPSQWTRLHPNECAGRDQFRDIFVWGKNRVKLDVPDEHNSYINASPIKIFSDRTKQSSHYIAMQAPKRETADHVWRMAFEQCQSPSVIIMLTNDGGFPYYPKDQGESRAVNEHDEFEDRFHGVVTCEEFKVSDDGATEIRKLVMKVEGVEEEKSFYHLLYLRWPDYGIPKESEKQSLTNLIHLANSLNKSSENQRIVHCRAGVGRTGTFMALDFLLRELEEGAFAGQVDPSTGEPWKKGDDDVFSTVNTLRMQRALSVQTSIQYKLIYQMLREAFEKKYGVVVKSAGSEASGSRPSSKGLGFGGPTILHLDGADEDDPFM